MTKVQGDKQPEMLQPGMYADELPEPLPFAGLEKSAAVQGTKIFAAPNIKGRDCLVAAVKLLYLMAQGELLSPTESTDIFFATTKLFQSEDQDLRRQVYCLMKELSTTAEQMFIATHTLCKDINSPNDMYKANAIRTLRKTTEISMLGPGERYLQQAVVDKNTNVSSAALVTGIHLMKDAPELVKKWSNEVSEALKQRNSMVQYHALGLLQKLKKNNRLFVLKQVQSVQTIPIRSAGAICLLIRMCTDILQDDFSGNQELYQFVRDSLRHGNEVVVFEAAKSICSLRDLTPKELGQVVLVLQLYLSFHKPVLKFAALRLLNKMAATHPLAVTSCSIDMETLFTDSNRNIATLAITTILMTGSEYSIDRLMKQISKFLSDIADEFKSVVIESMKVLGRKFPHKHPVLLQFLNDALKEEGGFEYKMSIVETIANLVETSPTAKEEGLMMLCELIEDCEYTKISQRVLSLLGQEGPANATPSKFVRFIYNRVLLEAPSVRAAAVSTLAKFATKCESLRESILILLQRAAMDNDDEVRDRAIFYITMLSFDDKELAETFVEEVEKEVKTAVPTATSSGEAPPAPEAAGGLLAAVSFIPEEESKWAKELEAIPQFKKLGKPFASSEPMSLTEKDVEYVVTCVKHCYNENMVLHFKINNTLEDQAFYNVQVKVAVEEDEDLASMQPLFAIPAEVIEPNSDASCYVCLKRDPDEGYAMGSCSATLLFSMDKDEEVDEYPLPEEVTFNLSDYMKGRHVTFAEEWDKFPDEEATEVTYELDTMKNLQTACNEVQDFYSFTACDGTGDVPTEAGTLSHTLHLSGQVCFAPPEDILIKAKIALTQSGSVSLTLIVKGGYDELRSLLCDSLI
eukprot:TRINITY_DN37336_c0_g1_i1.p1 TRINITY_DN37336_c0_g1~~TRINITY_DN37336_c0_g1_i1.p1  ORF type:complete len:860 (+),score=328.12 TRINITY_DN37336_c0_g1_i1:40-2619(+)